MNLETTYRLAKVFTCSQLRATSRVGGRLDFLRRPFSILLIDAAAFAGALVAVQWFTSVFGSVDSSLAVQVMVDLPIFLMALVMLSGLLWELSYSFSFTSTDMINHLPITAAEYVLASSASVAFTYSAYLALGLGVTLGLALQFGLLDAWAMTVVMSLVAVFIGAFGIEALRAFTNRVSSLLYRRSGRSVLILRAVVLIAVFVFFQLIFAPTIMLSLLGGITGGVQRAWYFPLVWPSLAVSSFLEGNLASGSVYAFLAFLLGVFLFSVCVRLRQVYWMPIPVSVKLSTSMYAPRAGFLDRLGLNPAESAIVKKDFRSLSRRREMVRFLAIPILVVAPMLIPSLMSTKGSPTATSEVMSLFLPLVFGVMLFALMNSASSVGQEGYAFWNLCSSPITAKEFVRAKVSANLLLSLPVALVFWVGIALFAHVGVRTSMAFLFCLTAVILCESCLGLAVAVRFPDFSEAVRSRFIRLRGMLVAMLLGFAVAGIVLGPFGLYVFFRISWISQDVYFAAALLGSLMLTALISAIVYRSCLSPSKKLFAELPV